MAKVRITKSPGGVPQVRQHMNAVPREQANIEAEGGETIVGDINQDGFLEHQRVSGKRHHQGGVPLQVGPGSFVFSDTRKLKIKDPDVLEHFTKSASKKGFTPAAIARQYDINSHIATLKDDTADPIAARTAQYMLDANMQKLSELSIVQESMKGFPNGIPALGESAAAGMGLGQDPEEMMRYGGLVRFQGGGAASVTDPTEPTGGYRGDIPLPEKGMKLYINDQEVEVDAADVLNDDRLFNNRYIRLSNGDSISYDEWTQIHAGEPLERQNTVHKNRWNYLFQPWTANTRERPRVISAKPVRVGRNFHLGDEGAYYQGDKVFIGDQEYEVVDPHGEYGKDYQWSWKKFKDTFDDTNGILTVKDARGKIKHFEGEDLQDLQKTDPRYVRRTQKQGAARQAAPGTGETEKAAGEIDSGAFAGDGIGSMTIPDAVATGAAVPDSIQQQMKAMQEEIKRLQAAQQQPVKQPAQQPVKQPVKTPAAKKANPLDERYADDPLYRELLGN